MCSRQVTRCVSLSLRLTPALLNNGILLADPTYPGENVMASNVVHHCADFASYIELPVVGKAQLPKIHGIKKEFEVASPQIDYQIVLEKGPALLERLMLSSQIDAKVASQGAIGK